jgi:restriction endonuclease S subunit
VQYSIVQKAKISQEDIRLDPEFYHPLYLDLERKLSKKNNLPLGDLCYLYDGPFGSELLANSYSEDGVPALRMQNITNDGLLELGNVEYISEYQADELSKHIAYPGEVVTTKIGFLGYSTVLSKEYKRYFFRRELTRLEIKDRAILNPYYLATFFNTYFGRQQALRFSSGTTRDRVLLINQRKMLIPLLVQPFQQIICELCKQAYSKIGTSKTTYNQAQTLLLFELGLLNWKPEHHLSFIKNYSDSKQAERFDAEYFQPKYDEIVAAIKNYAGGWDILGNLVSVKKCVEVGSAEYLDEGIPFIRISNLSPFEIAEEKYISEKLYSELTQHQPRQGEILFSKDATPGIAYHLREEPKKMIPSGGILRLNMKNKRVNADYLTLVLNSLIVKEQINRDVGGSVILHWRPDQVKQTLIPIHDEYKQEEIQQKIIESSNLRKQSKHLLECAKRAVEIAIEENEEEAEKWLKEEVGVIN